MLLICRLKWAGLLPFARLSEDLDPHIKRLAYDHSLLTALVDRWRPETHTFHFHWGEMAPTLQDVSYLLGLPLAGQAIGPLQAPANWAEDMANRFQGILPNVALNLAQDVEHHGPKYDWLLKFQVSMTSFNFCLRGHYLYHCVVIFIRFSSLL